MQKIKYLPLAMLLLAFTNVSFAGVPVDGTKNILLIIADDMGVDQVSGYAEHDDAPTTDHLDDLATNGVMFRNAWTHPSCAPARAAIITGRHAFRNGVTHPGGTAGDLATAEETFAEILQTAGYETAAFGKWGLGSNANELPQDQGFDYFAGALGDDIADYESWDKTVWDGSTSTTTVDHTTYATLDTATEAMDWIEDIDTNTTNPWLAYVAFNAPHTPYHEPPLSSTYDQTITTCFGAGRPTCYRAAIETMDYYIGAILDKLGTGTGNLDILDDTLVIFIADNGTPNPAIIAETDSTPFTLLHGKTTVYEGGINVPMIIYGGANMDVDAAVEVTDVLYGMDIFQTILDVSNTSISGTQTIDAHSLVGYLDETTDPTERTTLYSEVYNSGQNIDSWTMFNGTAKYIYYYNGVEECYRTSTDAGEVDDKWGTGIGVDNACANQLKPNRTCLGTTEGCPTTL